MSATLTGCGNEASDHQALIEEVRQTEEAFSLLAAEKGVKEAFLTYAADDAVLMRDNKPVKGKEAIAAYFDGQTLRNVKLQWKPEFIDVAASGDMAYTYGPYTFSAQHPEGEAIQSEGYFHTVWKRQDDGSWKFVYD